MTASNIISLELPMPEIKPRNKIPPTLDELKSYFQKISMPASEAEHMFDFYSSNGWKVGKNKMVDFESAARNWKRNCEKYGGVNKFQVRSKTVFELKTVKDVKFCRMKELEFAWSHEAPTGEMSWGKNIKQHGEWLMLKKEIRLLNDQIGGMA